MLIQEVRVIGISSIKCGTGSIFDKTGLDRPVFLSSGSVVACAFERLGIEGMAVIISKV